MTLEEQVSLLAGRNMWETVPNERLGIPRMRVSDGPAGVRGTSFEGPESLNIPCATSLAATWDRSLVRAIGELLGRENHSKGSRVHLAPTGVRCSTCAACRARAWRAASSTSWATTPSSSA